MCLGAVSWSIFSRIVTPEFERLSYLHSTVVKMLPSIALGPPDRRSNLSVLSVSDGVGHPARRRPIFSLSANNALLPL